MCITFQIQELTVCAFVGERSGSGAALSYSFLEFAFPSLLHQNRWQEVENPYCQNRSKGVFQNIHEDQ